MNGIQAQYANNAANHAPFYLKIGSIQGSATNGAYSNQVPVLGTNLVNIKTQQLNMVQVQFSLANPNAQSAQEKGDAGKIGALKGNAPVEFTLTRVTYDANGVATLVESWAGKIAIQEVNGPNVLGFASTEDLVWDEAGSKTPLWIFKGAN